MFNIFIETKFLGKYIFDSSAKEESIKLFKITVAA